MPEAISKNRLLRRFAPRNDSFSETSFEIAEKYQDRRDISFDLLRTVRGNGEPVEPLAPHSRGGTRKCRLPI